MSDNNFEITYALHDVTKEILTESQAATLLACAQSTIKEAIRQGRIPAVRFGDESVIPVSALVEELNRAAVERMQKIRDSQPPTPTAVSMSRPEGRRLPQLMQ